MSRLDGIVATRVDEPYRPGECVRVKTKNRDHWRYEIEREGALKPSRPRRFVYGLGHHRRGGHTIRR